MRWIKFIVFIALFVSCSNNKDSKECETLPANEVDNQRGEKGLNFLTTSSERGQESGFGYLYATQIIEGYTINRHYHSHPKGKHFGEKDKKLAASLIQHAVDLKRRKPLIFLYYTPTKQMIKKKEQK